MIKSNILITEDINSRWIEKLKSRYSVRLEPDFWQFPDKIKTILPEYEVLIVRNQTHVSKEIIAEGSKLKIIGRAGAGVDNIDVDAASKAGIVVTNTPDQNSISVAELTICMMLSLARKLTIANEHVRDGNWQRQRFMGTELYGKTFGVVGLGRIGFLTSLRAYAFGMDILAYDTFISPDTAVVSETRAELVGLNELLDKADFVSSHLPLTSETKHFFNYEQFCRMKSSAFFLNLARGEVVDEKGLIRALQEGQICGAGLDVLEKEPPDKNPLSEMVNVILTPHIAAFTKEAQDRVLSAVCKDIISVLEGKRAQNYINFSRPGTSESLLNKR